MPRKPPQQVERTATGPVRCAIYTRKSSEEGLEQPFNSLDAQREAAEAYIASQRHQGWIALPERYDDGGYSGGNMERPALQRLLASLQAGGIDCLVVYKVDRLSRSLLDFARIMGVLEQRGTSFVSITQQFNTTSSIGRLTLNVLLSFAQFERELISERTRDKMSAARRKGKWVGGIPPLGYDVAAGGGRLVVNEGEAEVVRKVFTLYQERRSVLAVAEELNRLGRTTKQWTSQRGRPHAGMPFSKNAVSVILNNLTYTGQVRYRGETYAGEHVGIVPPGQWEQVQGSLQSRRGIERKGGRGETSLLSGLLYCAHCGVSMVASYTNKGGRRYRYYLCLRAQQRGWKNCPTKSVSAVQIEEAVWERVRTITPLESAAEPRAAEPRECAGESVRQAVERITYDRAQKLVRLTLRKEFGGEEFAIPLVRLGHQEKLGRLPRITRLMALAVRCQELLRTGTVQNYAELARLGIVSRPRMTQVMNLLNLAPEIQEEVLFLPEVEEGREPVSERALRRLPGVISWKDQLEIWNQLRGQRPSPAV
jgi:site-specific DNA recombinase